MDIFRCRQCILPSNFPGINFTKEGICQFCFNDQDNLDFDIIRNEVENIISGSLGKAPTYDIVLAYSGGKDSTFALLYLKDKFPQARIIAITIDNNFLSEVAWNNCRKIPATVGVDHIVLRPDPNAMREVYRVSTTEDLYGMVALKRASSICNSCIQIINTQILTFASNYDIPFVMGGYIGGQVPSHSGVMEQNLTMTNKLRESFVQKLSRHLDDNSTRLFKQEIGTRSSLRIINPMIYLNPTETEIFDRISLVGWDRPTDTGGASTNCLLNDFAINEHLIRHGYHPYIFEISTMVRKGLISREEALRKITFEVSKEGYGAIREKLGIGETTS